MSETKKEIVWRVTKLNSTQSLIEKIKSIIPLGMLKRKSAAVLNMFVVMTNIKNVGLPPMLTNQLKTWWHGKSW